MCALLQGYESAAQISFLHNISIIQHTASGTRRGYNVNLWNIFWKRENRAKAQDESK